MKSQFIMLYGRCDRVWSRNLQNDITLKHILHVDMTSTNYLVIKLKTINFVFVFVCYALIFFFNSREFIDGERKLKRKLIQEREEQKLRQSAEEELRVGHEYSQAYRSPANPKLPPIRK